VKKPSPTRLALDIRDQDSDIWTWDLTRHTLTRLTFDAAVDMLPIWTPDSRRIIFASLRGGAANLFWHAADGTGADQRMTTSANAQSPSSASPDGASVLGSESLPNTATDLMRFGLDGAASSGAEPAEPLTSKPAEALLQTKFDELNPDFSPDGRYFAYESNESGRAEIYVRPYPKVNDGRWQVSTGGGTRPAWARNGAELFYVDPLHTLIAVPVRMTGATFSAGNPAKVFDTKYGMHVATRGYDVSADGRRFVMIKAGASDGNAPPTSLIVVANWFEELKAKVPVK
jgi:Tol biopolymer transport system component